MAEQGRSKHGNGGSILISFFSFTNQLSSLRRERLIRGVARGASPAASIVPVEARRKTRNGSLVAQEPGSPKVSCMGRVERKKKAPKPKSHEPEERKDHHEKNKKPSSSSSSRFLKNDQAPTLVQLKKFSNGRESFANFDWKAKGVLVNGDRALEVDLGKNRSRAFPNPLYESDDIRL